MQLSAERKPTLPSSVPRSDQTNESVTISAHAIGVAALPRYSAVTMTVIMMPGILMGSVDQGIVDVCLVTIANTLNAPMHKTQWVLLVYFLVTASLQVTAGRLGDRHSKSRMYQIGLLMFAGSSAGCGFSTSVEALIAMRAMQGVGNALMGSNSLAIIKSFTKPEEITIAMGYASSLIGLGMSLGPPLGGLLTHAFGWPSVFFINVPLGVLALLLARCRLPDTPASPAVSLDPVGSALVFVSVGSGMFALSASHELSAVLTLGCGLVSLLLLVALAVWLRHAAKPVVPRPVLASRPIRSGLLVACGLFFSIALARFMLPLYLQTGMGWSQAETGAALMCQPVTMLLVGLGSGRLVKRIGPKAQMSLALLLLAAAVLLLGAGLGSAVVMGSSMVMLAIGQTLFMPANQEFVMACAAKDQLSIVGALIQMCRSVSLPLGIVCCTALLSALSARPDATVSAAAANATSDSPASTLSTLSTIDVGAARTTVWLYLLPTAAALVLALNIRGGEPAKACSAAPATVDTSAALDTPVPAVRACSTATRA